VAEYRIGHGYDVHRLVEGRPLILGGEQLDHDKGLAGHSDADVLLHAITDAILGALGLPDIGQQFPPDDPTYKDANSADLLGRVLAYARKRGLTRIVNVDAIVMAERPKINPAVPAMRARIAEILGTDLDRVGIKATTTERLGFVGREEGIAASAVCLVEIDA